MNKNNQNYNQENIFDAIHTFFCYECCSIFDITFCSISKNGLKKWTEKNIKQKNQKKTIYFWYSEYVTRATQNHDFAKILKIDQNKKMAIDGKGVLWAFWWKQKFCFDIYKKFFKSLSFDNQIYFTKNIQQKLSFDQDFYKKKINDFEKMFDWQKNNYFVAKFWLNYFSKNLILSLVVFTKTFLSLFIIFFKNSFEIINLPQSNLLFEQNTMFEQKNQTKNFSQKKDEKKIKTILGRDYVYDIFEICNQNMSNILIVGAGETKFSNHTLKNNIKEKYSKIYISFYNFDPNSHLMKDIPKNLGNKNKMKFLSFDNLFQSFEELDNFAKWVKDSKQYFDVIIVCIGGNSGKQEFLVDWIQKSNIKFGICCGLGAALDHLGNGKKQKKVPYFLQKIGMEWFFRIFTNPKRILRIFNSVFGLFFITYLSCLNFETNLKKIITNYKNKILF